MKEVEGSLDPLEGLGHPGPASWIAKFAVILTFVVILSACGGEEPSEVVVAGQAVNTNRFAKLRHIGLFLGDEFVASGAVRADGSFRIRIKRTDDMEEAQSADGFVTFTLGGSSEMRKEECGFLRGPSGSSVRFENGRWVAVDTQEPAFIVLERARCPRVADPWGSPVW